MTRDHVYVCANGHPERRVVLKVKFPDDPVVPWCDDCGIKMRKDYGSFGFVKAYSWEFGHPLKGKSKYGPPKHKGK